MLRKVKNWLGIEGVRIEILTAEKTASNPIKGVLRLHSKSPQFVKEVELKLVEKYVRGRRKNKRIDEYILGEAVVDCQRKIEAEETVDIPFELPYKKMLSPIQDFASKNFLYAGIGKLAEFTKGVKVYHRIEAGADIKGNAVKPLSTIDIILG